MRAIAEYAMRGRTQATTVAAVSVAIPFCFWISAATISLVTLRKGWNEGLILLLWASLPAAVWLFLQHDPTPLVVMVCTMALAHVLRVTSSWSTTLAAATLVGAVLVWIVFRSMPELVGALTDELIRIAKQQAPEFLAQYSQESEEIQRQKLRAVITGVMAASMLLAIVGSLILGRWWQALLFNPGGFRKEFHRLKLPSALALALVLPSFFSGLPPVLIALVPPLSVPLLIAAMALVHGIVGLKGLAGHWLVAFYLVLFFVPYAYKLLIILVLIDTWFDFRARIAANSQT